MVNNSKLSELYEPSAKLCRAVEAHPCLYDRNNSQYSKREVADAAWEVIAKHCDNSVESCKVRWDNIRTAYKRSFKNIGEYYLADELKFYRPHVRFGNSEKVDCADDSNDDESNTSAHSKRGSRNDKVPERIKERRKSTYEAMNKTLKQSKTNLYSDDEEDDNDKVSRGEKKQKQAKAIDKSTKKSAPQLPKKDGTIILKKHEPPKTVDYQSETNDVNEDKMATPKKRLRSKRARKRGINRTIIKKRSDRKHQTNEKRMRLSNQETPEENATTWAALEMNAASPSMNQKEKYDNNIQLNSDQHNSNKRQSPLTKHNENEINSTVPVVYIDRVVQCEIEKPNKSISSDQSIEDFLNMLRPRLEEMNMRKKLQFQMKVFQCLISTLDDNTDFSTVDHELQIPKNMPIESKIVEELRSIRELLTKPSVVQKPTMIDAATIITNETVPETIPIIALNTDNVNLAEIRLNSQDPHSTPDKIDLQNSINSSLITTMASDVGTLNIPCAPNTTVSATSGFERTNSGSTVIMTTVNGVAKSPNTTPSTSNSRGIPQLNDRPHNMLRFSICANSPLTNMTRESHQQIITTSANVPSTIWNFDTTGKPRRIMRASTIHQFNEPEQHSPNNNTFLVSRTVTANTTLTTSTTTKPTPSVSRNGSSSRPSNIENRSPKMVRHIQMPQQQQSTVVPVNRTSVRTTTSSVVSSGTGSTTVAASTSSHPNISSSLNTLMTVGELYNIYANTAI